MASKLSGRAKGIVYDDNYVEDTPEKKCVSPSKAAGSSKVVDTPKTSKKTSPVRVSPKSPTKAKVRAKSPTDTQVNNKIQ